MHEGQNAMDKTELLYDHYKETFSLIKENLSQRNYFFVMVFLVMILQFLFAASPESITSLMITAVRQQYGIDITDLTNILQSLLWLILLYLTMRYYQSTIFIERQYHYIHLLEADIAKYAKIKFDREGGSYLSHYPKINDFIDLLYKWVFPVIYCLIISYKIITELCSSKFSFTGMLDIVLFLACFILTVLYLLFLHNK